MLYLLIQSKINLTIENVMSNFFAGKKNLKDDKGSVL